MKKLSFFAALLAAVAFTACGGNKNAQTAEQDEAQKSFEQTQIEERIKIELDSLAAELGKMKQLPIVKTGDGGIKITDEDKKVKPDYLLNVALADSTETLVEKYRLLSALSVDKKLAEAYDMPVEEYSKAISKLAAEIDDPSFKAIEDTNTLHETAQGLYDAMNENGRINFFWQMAATSLVEQLYIISQNADRFLVAFDDESASLITFRLILLQDAIERLTEYDENLVPVADALQPLYVLNATSVAELKAQLATAKEQIDAARAALLKQ